MSDELITTWNLSRGLRDGETHWQLDVTLRSIFGAPTRHDVNNALDDVLTDIIGRGHVELDQIDFPGRLPDAPAWQERAARLHDLSQPMANDDFIDDLTLAEPVGNTDWTVHRDLPTGDNRIDPTSTWTGGGRYCTNCNQPWGQHPQPDLQCPPMLDDQTDIPDPVDEDDEDEDEDMAFLRQHCQNVYITAAGDPYTVFDLLSPALGVHILVNDGTNLEFDIPNGPDDPTGELIVERVRAHLADPLGRPIRDDPQA